MSDRRMRYASLESFSPGELPLSAPRLLVIKLGRVGRSVPVPVMPVPALDRVPVASVGVCCESCDRLLSPLCFCDACPTLCWDTLSERRKADMRRSSSRDARTDRDRAGPSPASSTAAVASSSCELRLEAALLSSGVSKITERRSWET